jgi:two-component system response regulator YesN
MLFDYVTLIMDGQALEASNGLEAIGIVKRQRPDVVLLDLTMPGQTGYETIRHIRELDPRIRIVVMTGDTSAGTRREVERLGVEFLAKPLDFRVLDAVLGRTR